MLLALDHLEAQTAAVFLFNQRGQLERVGLDGRDNGGNTLSNSSLPLELHEPGHSFTGRTVLKHSSSKFGEPQWSNDLSHLDSIDHATWKCYQNVLGPLRSAISVPLNGSNRTFGTLEVINRKAPGTTDFSHSDVFWLSAIANELAWSISKYRHTLRSNLLFRLAEGVVSAVSDAPYNKKLFQDTADALVAPPMPYQVCIIRLLINGLLHTVASSASGILLADRDQTPISGTIGLPSRALQTKRHIYIQDISELDPALENLRNWRWAKNAKLRSYCCFPLEFDHEMVGTMSLYLGYIHELSEGELAFIKTMSFFLAACSKVKNTIREFREILTEDAADLSAAFFDGVGTPRRHETLANLRDIESRLEKLEGRNLATEANKVELKTVIQLVEDERLNLKADLARAAPENLSINEMIQHIVQQRKKVPFHPYIDFVLDFDSELPIITARSQALRFALKDLITNSIKAIQRTGKDYGLITITTSQVLKNQEETIQILIEDTGDGIPRDKWEDIFNWGVSYSNGSGAGLYLARHAISMELGEIRVVASRVGEGTVFRIQLPVTRPSETTK